MKIKPIITFLVLLTLPLFSLSSEEAQGKQKQSLYDMALGQVDAEADTTNEETATGIFSSMDIDRADKNGVTPLMKAAKEGNDWTVRLLLNLGANVNARDKEGWTALMYAVRYQNNYNIVSLLTDNGAGIQVRNQHNATPLLLAASYTQNPDILSLLLEGRSGAEEEVFNAFILAVEDEKSSPLIKEAKLDSFFKKNVPVNGFFRGLTPLMYACKYNATSLAARCLLERGADISLLDAANKNALDYALENPSFPHDRVFSLLIKGRDL